jgi:hydrogen peroxide-dependent heme synthase
MDGMSAPTSDAPLAHGAVPRPPRSATSTSACSNTMYAVSWAEHRLADRTGLAVEAQEFLDAGLHTEVCTRGSCDIGGLRTTPTCWCGGPVRDVTSCRRSGRGPGIPASAGTWPRCGRASACTGRRVQPQPHAGLRPARGPGKYVCVYHSDRSLQWYLLPDYERRGLLAETRIMGREYEDVRPHHRLPAPPARLSRPAAAPSSNRDAVLVGRAQAGGRPRRLAAVAPP